MAAAASASPIGSTGSGGFRWKAAISRRAQSGNYATGWPKDSALAIGFGSTDKASQAILSLAVYPRYVSLFLLNGAKLDDPNKIMEGCGSKARHIKLRPVSLLENPDVIALIDTALEQAAMPMPGNDTAPLIIKSISEKQRPRRSS